MKPFFASKLNWLGILTFLAGASIYADQVSPEYAKYVLLVSGVATVVLRTFFTSATVGGDK